MLLYWHKCRVNKFNLLHFCHPFFINWSSTLKTYQTIVRISHLPTSSVYFETLWTVKMIHLKLKKKKNSNGSRRQDIKTADWSLNTRYQVTPISYSIRPRDKVYSIYLLCWWNTVSVPHYCLTSKWIKSCVVFFFHFLVLSFKVTIVDLESRQTYLGQKRSKNDTHSQVSDYEKAEQTHPMLHKIY